MWERDNGKILNDTKKSLRQFVCSQSKELLQKAEKALTDYNIKKKAYWSSLAKTKCKPTSIKTLTSEWVQIRVVNRLMIGSISLITVFKKNIWSVKKSVTEIKKRRVLTDWSNYRSLELIITNTRKYPYYICLFFKYDSFTLKTSVIPEIFVLYL